MDWTEGQGDEGWCEGRGAAGSEGSGAGAGGGGWKRVGGRLEGAQEEEEDAGAVSCVICRMCGRAVPDCVLSAAVPGTHAGLSQDPSTVRYCA